jgi:hypothetical protein
MFMYIGWIRDSIPVDDFLLRFSAQPKRESVISESASTSAAEELGIATSRSSSAWPQARLKSGRAS